MIGVVNEVGFVCVVVLDLVIFLVFFWSYHVVVGGSLVRMRCLLNLFLEHTHCLVRRNPNNNYRFRSVQWKICCYDFVKLVLNEFFYVQGLGVK